MRAGDVAGDRKAKAGAALVLVAGIVEPQERLEHFLAHVGRNSRPVVIDRHRQIAVIAVAGDGDRVGVARDSTTTIEAKWLGACKADQKPGDIMMPGGMKMNIKDMEKLKALIPKQPGK